LHHEKSGNPGSNRLFSYRWYSQGLVTKKSRQHRNHFPTSYFLVLVPCTLTGSSVYLNLWCKCG
jgi:hypothetical protein